MSKKINEVKANRNTFERPNGNTTKGRIQVNETYKKLLGDALHDLTYSYFDIEENTFEDYVIDVEHLLRNVDVVEVSRTIVFAENSCVNINIEIEFLTNADLAKFKPRFYFTYDAKGDEMYLNSWFY